jgi:hypothetical protein
MALPQEPWRVDGKWVCPGTGGHEEYQRLRALLAESIAEIETRKDSVFVATSPCGPDHQRVVLIKSK